MWGTQVTAGQLLEMLGQQQLVSKCCHVSVIIYSCLACLLQKELMPQWPAVTVVLVLLKQGMHEDKSYSLVQLHQPCAWLPMCLVSP
jgi:hypothetical protein